MRDLRGVLEDASEVPSLVEFYPTLSQWYDTFGFTDQITDAQRLAEYGQILQQFKKFVGSNRRAIADLADDTDKLTKYVKDLFPGQAEYPKTRVEIVYQALRNSFINTLLGVIDGEDEY